MSRIPILFACSLALVPSIVRAQGLPPDFARLVPEDSVLLVAVRSADQLAVEWAALRTDAAPDATPRTGAALLGLLAQPLDLPGDVAQLDPSQPAGVLLRVEKGEVTPTFIVPTREPQAWIATTDGSAETLSFATAGKYVACTLGAPLAPSKGASRLLDAWPSTFVAARLDAARLVAAFRMQIDAALGQFESLIDGGMFENAESGVDMTELMQFYLQFAKDFVDSADVLELSLDVRNGAYALDGALKNRAGSALSRYASTERVDYTDLARRIDPNMVMQTIGSYSQASLTEVSFKAYDAAFASLEQMGTFPEPLIDALKQVMQHGEALQRLAGHSIASGFELDPRGARAVALLAPPDPAAFDQAWQDFVGDPAFPPLGVTAGTFADATIAGARARVATVAVDLRQAAKLLPESGSMGAAPQAQLAQELVQRLFGGPSMTVAIVHAEPRIGVLVGGDDAWRTAAVKRLLGGGEPSPALALVAAKLDGANPAYGASGDFARAMLGFSDLFRGTAIAEQDTDDMLGTLREFGAKPLPFSCFWAVRAESWKFGFGVDAAGLRAFAKRVGAIQAAQAKRAEMRAEVSSIMFSLARWAHEHDGRYPSALNELAGPDEYGAPYFDGSLADPWGRPYVYELAPDGSAFVVRSLGADGKAGGRGQDADFSSETLPKQDFLDEQFSDEDMEGDEGGDEGDEQDE